MINNLRLYLSLTFFYFLSAHASAGIQYSAVGHTGGCGSTPQEACSLYSFTANNGDSIGCVYQNGPRYTVNGNINYNYSFNASSCSVPPPPSCDSKTDQTFSASGFPDNWETADEDGCYAYCYHVQGSTNAECKYTGDSAEDADEDNDFDNFDTSAPEYCNYRNQDGSCADFNHPDNEGGCNKNGRVYGEADLGNGTVQGCFSASSDYEPEIKPKDTDNDGIPDNQDSDIDNDGIPNSDDSDIDGNGQNERADTDGDGIADENDGDIDGDGIPNGQDGDSDGDGIANGDDPTPNGGGGQSPCVGDQCDGEGEDGKGSGQATDCSTPPTSEGDKQLAAIHKQLWINACEKGDFGETSDYYQTDDESRTYDSVMGDFKGRIQQSAISTGLSSFFDVTLSGGCPTYSVDAWAFSITLDQWCDESVPWGLIGGVIISLCSLIAIRIAFT